MGGCFGVDNTKSSSISEEAGLLGVQTRRILTLERDAAGALDQQNKPKPINAANSTTTNEQRIAARLFSSDTARLFRKTDASELDFKITTSPI